MLLIRLIRGKADYMSKYIDVVAERTGVSPTGHITTTNKDVMIPIVKEVVHIEEGTHPLDKDINKAWEEFIEDYRNNRIKL
jgi:stress response protein YsnF